MIYWNSFWAYFPCAMCQPRVVQCKNQLDASPPLNWTVEHSPHMICFRNFSWGFSISLVDVEYCCCEAAAAVTIWNRLARLSSIEKPDSDRLLLLPLPLPPPEISLFSWLLLQSENTHLIRRGMIFFSNVVVCQSKSRELRKWGLNMAR